MNPRTDQHVAAWRETIFARLRHAYATQLPLPEPDDNHDDLVAAEVCDARVLSLDQLQRLFRYVIAEYSE